MPELISTQIIRLAVQGDQQAISQLERVEATLNRMQRGTATIPVGTNLASIQGAIDRAGQAIDTGQVTRLLSNQLAPNTFGQRLNRLLAGQQAALPVALSDRLIRAAVGQRINDSGQVSPLFGRPLLSTALRVGFAGHFAEKMAEDFANKGATIAGTDAAFEKLSGGAEKASDRLSKFREITGGVAANLDLERVAIDAYTSGLADMTTGLRVTDDKLGGTLKLFIQLARLQGVDSETAVKRFTEGISNLHPRMAEKIIPGFDAPGAYKRFLDSDAGANYTSEDLEKNHRLKQAIFFKELSSSAEAQGKEVGADALAKGDALGAVIVTLKNSWNDLNKQVSQSPGFAEALGGIARSFRDLTQDAGPLIVKLTELFALVTSNKAIFESLIVAGIGARLGGAKGAVAALGTLATVKAFQAAKSWWNGDSQPHADASVGSATTSPGAAAGPAKVAVTSSSSTTTTTSGLDIQDVDTADQQSKATQERNAFRLSQRFLDEAERAGDSIGEQLAMGMSRMAQAAASKFNNSDGIPGIV